MGTPITSVFLNVTDACNMGCRYCFVEQHPRYMSYETAKAAADWLIANAAESGQTPAINFFGGEPLLCWDTIIVPLTKYIREEYGKPFTLSITTNGALLDEEKLDFMHKNQFGMLFSIDGDKETQDYNRPLTSGESSFDRVAWLVDRVPELHPNATFRSTLIPATCGNLFHNAQFAKEHGWKNIFWMPNCFEEWSDESRATVAAGMRQFVDWCIESFREGEGWPMRFSELDQAMRNITRINRAIRDGSHRPEKSCGACAKCGLGTGRFAAVNYAGDVFGCQELASPKAGVADRFWIGNIFNGIDEERRAALAADFDPEAVSGADCSACRLDHICNGGCVANNYMYGGGLGTVSPVWCWWQNLLLDEAIYMMQTLGDEGNEGFTAYWRGLNG